MQKTRVAVLRGGPSSEYDVSLKTGAAILNNLDQEKYTLQDILIDKSGVWHMRGLPKEPASIFPHIDVVVNAMHGEYGEDGTVQKVLDRFRVPYTGSNAAVSAVCMNKLLTKQALSPYIKNLPVRLAKHSVISPGPWLEDQLEKVLEEFSLPIVIKPLVGGSSVGVSIVKDKTQAQEAIEKALEHAAKVFVEEYIKGREATCGVVEGFRGEDIYALLPIEIVPASDRVFFDYAAKYEGASEEICPGNFSRKESETVQLLAREIHRALGLRHYSRSDFILSPNGIYFLEINTLPGLTEASLLPKALVAVGSSLPQFLDHLIEVAQKR